MNRLRSAAPRATVRTGGAAFLVLGRCASFSGRIASCATRGRGSASASAVERQADFV